MLHKDVLFSKALLKLVDLYGMEYVKSKLDDTYISVQEENSFVRYYFCLEDERERPELRANEKGWAVYATVNVDKQTGESMLVECMLPTGEKEISKTTLPNM